ncbi:OmpA family protein [Pedobacter africanus]|uniref:Outer membrane protein OmpA-like peptidoglycan-associated protein/tetratricopeptide (TPR) repeat protein n=1 Tax=Pedobacter africanus TaxID=151894 RepID=A0ACC6L4P0_9SPHI|nr:OmpA family protein [Pedobacter africanus]MDR6786258.1 outer membrane protein OmpA-like peptidoglycan-associated protein/tetratricopeptide (TPR) repeat protein [Pedobacter africanus]
MKTKILLILCLLASAAHAQFVTNSKRVADVYFQNKEYYAAAEYYKKALQISADSVGFVVPYGFESKIKEESPKREDFEYCTFQLAESLRLYKNSIDAEKWYAVAKDFTNPKYILSTFWYAETMRSNQKFDEAIGMFNEFLDRYKVKDSYTTKAKTEIASCKFALHELRYPRLFKLNRLQNNINDKGSNYTPTVRGGNFYFTSSRPVGTGGKKEILTDKNAKVAKKETPFLNAVYVASGNPMGGNISIKKTAVDGKDRESAAPAFHPNGKVAYVTSWTTTGNKKIYQLNATPGIGKDWSEPIELGNQVNVKGFNSMQPFVTSDGRYLIFSSDRPGGTGKYDLWYAAIRADGSLGVAVNMGNVINTAEDEQAPYYNNGTKKLLYSSNGRVGMGGFDFFESEGDFTKWSEARNLGYPFNSSKDDLYFTPTNNTDSEGYISSDRESLCCLEIFFVKREVLFIKGTLLDCNTMKPLKDATITLSDSTQQFKVITDEMGKYLFQVNSNRGFKLTAEKEKYFSKNISFSYEQMAQRDTLFSPELCLIPYEIDKPIVLKDVLYEFNKAELTEDSKGKLDHLYTIMVDNPTIEIELSAHTDSKGKDAYNLDLSNRRAKSCVDYLVGKGIPLSRMTSKGYGETRPVAPNELPNGKDNPAGRALNRRTEFKVTKK